MFLLMKLFNAFARRNFHSMQLSGSSHQKMFLSRPFGNLHWHRHCIKIGFAFRNFFFFFENKIFMFFLVLSYGISTTLLQVLISLRFPFHPLKDQRQPSRGVLKKRCSENIKQIFRRIPMPKCDFNIFAIQLYWNCTLAWVFSCQFAAYFQNIFS